MLPNLPFEILTKILELVSFSKGRQSIFYVNVYIQSRNDAQVALSQVSQRLRKITLPRLFEQVTIECVSDEAPHRLRIDHCFNAVRNYDWAAEFVRDIIITSPFHSNIDDGRRCPGNASLTQQALPEPPRRAGPVDQLEGVDGRDASVGQPPMIIYGTRMYECEQNERKANLQ
jgi:hypothetical protein